jgi:hypothetical protein
MTRILALTVALMWAGQAFAVEEKTAAPAEAAKPPPKAEAEAQAAAPAPEKLASIVRGLYVEMQVGGGYMVADQKYTKPDPTFPQLKGKSEKLGPGALMHMALGFDLTDNFAFELFGGNELVSGGRTDKVRDMALTFGGAGLRLAFDMDERLDFTITAGGALCRADNGVEKPTSSPAGYLDLGLEYYVHVRHFSVGMDVTVLAPLSPFRAFVGLGPQVKYTF